MEKTLWVYWDSGIDKMPGLIRRIYQHNVEICESFGWKVVLLTQDNIRKHIFLGEVFPERFFTMTPYDQSDFVRYYALRDHGGIWLDTDFIVHDNLDKLVAQMSDTQTFLSIREHIGGCMASATLVSKPDSAVARANCKTIERKMAEKAKFTDWGEIGPDVLRHIPEDIVSQLHVIDDVTAVASVNFANWRRNPGWNTHVWFKETPEQAVEEAGVINAYQLSIVGTWTIYRNHRPELSQRELERMVFDDDRSVFKALMDIKQIK